MSLNDLENLKNQLFALDDHSFNEIFSQERVELFGGKENYKRHLEFSCKIFPYIHLIEVLLRNRINYALINAIRSHQSSLFTSEEWLFDLIENNIPHPRFSDFKKKLCEILKPQIQTELSSKSNDEKKEIHSILISKLNLGTWRDIIAFSHEIDKVFFSEKCNLKKDIFPKLYSVFENSNSDFESFLDPVCHKGIDEKFPNLSQRIVIFVSFFTSLRNRMFHWEYLFKYDPNGHYSRIQTRFGSSKFSLVANEENIERYLKRLLESLS